MMYDLQCIQKLCQNLSINTQINSKKPNESYKEHSPICNTIINCNYFFGLLQSSLAKRLQ